MTGFLDFIEKSAQQTEDFVGDTKDLAINASADAGLGALGLAGKGIGAVASSPVVENPITQNAFTHAAKQTAEFVLGASQKYVTQPVVGALAKNNINPAWRGSTSRPDKSHQSCAGLWTLSNRQAPC